MTPGKSLCLMLLLLSAFASWAVLTEDNATLIIEDQSGRHITFDMAALEAMNITSLQTHTPWTDGPQQFTGIRLSQLLEGAGMRGHTVEALALNNYKTELNWDELTRYPVIIAFKHNGHYMRIRDKGPLWIIYPLDEYPELRSLDTETRMIWQLHRLIVK